MVKHTNHPMVLAAFLDVALHQENEAVLLEQRPRLVHQCRSVRRVRRGNAF